jgi:hypothetical protein
LGEDGDHYWDNPRSQVPENEAVMPDWSRGMMHVVTAESAGSRGLKPIKVAQVTDGTSKTLLVGEYHTRTYESRRTFWAYGYTSYNQSSTFVESRTLIADYVRCQEIGGGGVHTCKRAWGSLHAGELIQFVYGDGSVHGVDPNVDINVFALWGAIADGGAELEPPPTRGRG